MSSPPQIVRVAGLPASAVEPFSSPLCLEAARAILDLEKRLDMGRSRMVEALHAAIHDSPGEVRRVLLAVKRDCFNGRPLSARRGTSAWALIEQTAPALVAELCQIEEEIPQAEDYLGSIFVEEQDREKSHLLKLLQEENLRRGIAFTSPSLFENLERLTRPRRNYSRKERGLEQSLWRYATRTALKITPFSTLTRMGLGLVTESALSPSVRLVGKDWGQRRLFRIKKILSHQYFAALKLHPTFRDLLRVALNPTLAEITPARFRLIRPSQWYFDREAQELRYREDALITFNLKGSLVSTLREQLSEAQPFGALVVRLVKFLGQPEAELVKTLNSLVDIGLLHLETPWVAAEMDTDCQLLKTLRGLPQDETLEKLTKVLERLTFLRETEVGSDALPGLLSEVDCLISEGLKVLNSFLGVAEVQPRARRKLCNEDVFLLEQVVEGEGEVAHISREAAEQAILSIMPVLRAAHLTSTHFNYLLSAQAAAKRQWAGKSEVSFLEFFDIAQTLWRDLMKYTKNARQIHKWGIWNPLELPSIEELTELRHDVAQRVAECIHPDGEDLAFTLPELEKAVARIPDLYAPPLGPVLFLQPADANQGLWMMNRLLDGTARFSSRHTAAMPARMRERYTHYLTRCGTIELHGQVVDLVDIQSFGGDYLNTHAAQTPRVLEMPGDVPSLPPERRLGLADLRVRLDAPLPYLVDPQGRRILPVFLGGMSLMIMPILTKVLSQFGFGEYSLADRQIPGRQEGDTTFFPRLRVGNLILRRRRWVVSPIASLDTWADRSDIDLYMAANRWRLRHGVPDHAFIAEKLPIEFIGADVYKPQYVNFTSPLSVPVFRSCLKSQIGQMSVEEMLPGPEAFPLDEQGRRWAFEVQLESLVLAGAQDKVRQPEIQMKDQSRFALSSPERA
jgi:hypothetical protein